LLKIYHVRGTRSVRPIWLCFELELPVEIVPIDFSSSYRDSPEWRSISPAGKVPALTDGDMTMVESGAMVEYILERYGDGRLKPKASTADSALHHQWCWFSESTLLRPLGINRILRATSDDASSLLVDAGHKTQDCLDVIEQTVTGREYLLGEQFYAADIMMGYALGLIAKLGLLNERYPQTQSYLDRISSRDAFIRAMNA
jgi:glutathione S-transferase